MFVGTADEGLETKTAEAKEILINVSNSIFAKVLAICLIFRACAAPMHGMFGCLETAHPIFPYQKILILQIPHFLRMDTLL